MLTLWRYNRMTGFWAVARQCSEGTAEAWQRIFMLDEPGEYFYLTRGHRPKFDPIPRDRTAP